VPAPPYPPRMIVSRSKRSDASIVAWLASHPDAAALPEHGGGAYQPRRGEQQVGAEDRVARRRSGTVQSGMLRHATLTPTAAAQVTLIVMQRVE
jgi:hypothetical protein